jgi:glycosyltransferase involved in cell wall biosynthesis
VKVRILLISQWFDPEPTFKGLIFALELASRGHRVEVITGFPNYPGGKLYPGYRVRIWQRELIRGIPVLRVPLYPSHDQSVVGRIFNYFSFAVSATIGSLFVKRPDVIYAYHPPVTVSLPALFARAIYQAPLVYDIQDLWPDTVAATGMVRSGWILSLINRWCSLIYSKADRLVVLSPGFKRMLTHRGVPEKKVEVIYNWCDEKALVVENSTRKVRAEETFRVLFAGGMGLAQALDSVLEAAKICLSELPMVRFIFIGGGVERDRLERKSKEMALSNVQFQQRVPMSEMSRVLSDADILLVHLKDDPLFEITIPSKTQAYLAAGKPVLMAVKGDAADLVRRSAGGTNCLPEDPQSIVNAIAELMTKGADQLTEMAKSGQAFYFRELSLRAGTDRFERIFHSLVNGAPHVQQRDLEPSCNNENEGSIKAH